MSTSKKDIKEPNDIRIGIGTRPQYAIKYAASVMDEKKITELKFSAVGGSIGHLLDIVEIFKVLKPGLYQQNKISSVTYQAVDSNNELLQQRLFPKLEVTLSKEEPKNKTEGFQGQMDEKKRKEIEIIMNKRKEMKKKRGQRGRGGPRRRTKGRGRRVGFRERRGFERPRRGSRPRGRGRRVGFRGRRGFGRPRGSRPIARRPRGRGRRVGFRGRRGFGRPRRGSKPIVRGLRGRGA